MKPLSDFNRETRRPNGKRTECRGCQRVYNNSFRARFPLYNIWNLMMQRCYNEDHAAFRLYGARGIQVCERWHTYELFAADLTPRPSSKHSIDRIDNDGNYCPENCRWVTQAEQTLNLRTNHLIEVNGVTHPLAEWARINGIPHATVEARIYRYGWDEVAAVTIPARHYARKGDHG